MPLFRKGKKGGRRRWFGRKKKVEADKVEEPPPITSLPEVKRTPPQILPPGSKPKPGQVVGKKGRLSKEESERIRPKPNADEAQRAALRKSLNDRLKLVEMGMFTDKDNPKMMEYHQEVKEQILRDLKDLEG